MPREIETFLLNAAKRSKWKETHRDTITQHVSKELFNSLNGPFLRRHSPAWDRGCYFIRAQKVLYISPSQFMGLVAMWRHRGGPHWL